ncbi:hypothetical protein B5S28_g378 [[Candida] boidinii]|uniref:Unnamed protein product n=1 Tax=Candida boidinii TaxID=5477 RepID=A0ACB5TKN2_CANBO|nr:hypothetical protein B5S28_g378 [[Candida] boidinii]OWB62911.1 hypothetical protein B5S29_g3860 [[Candida] boidinii]OWB78300.1 hypothetical protein B5S32_g2490 [[Candida] boidinii]GME90442.1 unnamed protein product [[Candida] boidinii]
MENESVTQTANKNDLKHLTKEITIQDISVHSNDSHADLYTNIERVDLDDIEGSKLKNTGFGSRPSCFKNAFQEYVCVLVLAFAPSASTMAAAAYQVSLTSISDHFDVYGGELTWSVSSVMLANGSCLLLMGGLADAFGRRNTLLFGYISYSLSALIGGFMKNFVVVCIFRALQGMFVAASIPSAVGFLGATYENGRRKNLVMSIFAAGGPIGGSFGFILGAVFSQIFNWRAVHFYLAIFFGILALLAFLLMPVDKEIEWRNAFEIAKKLDYFGSFISLAGFTLICFSLTDVDSAELKWHTSYIIALLIVGIALIAGFVLYELYVPEAPLMPMQLWKSKNFCLSVIIGSFVYMEFFGVLNFFAALYFEQIRHYSPIITGCCFIVQPISGIIFNITAGLTMHIIPGTVLVIIGSCGATTAAIIWATNSIDRNYFLGPFWGFMLAISGIALVYNVANRIALSSVDISLQSRAAGTFNTCMQIASTIGLSISATIVSTKNPYYGTKEQTQHLVELFESFKYAYYFAIGCGCTSLICSCFVRVGVVGNEDTDDSSGDGSQDAPKTGVEKAD